METVIAVELSLALPGPTQSLQVHRDYWLVAAKLITATCGETGDADQIMRARVDGSSASSMNSVGSASYYTDQRALDEILVHKLQQKTN